MQKPEYKNRFSALLLPSLQADGCQIGWPDRKEDGRGLTPFNSDVEKDISAGTAFNEICPEEMSPSTPLLKVQELCLRGSPGPPYSECRPAWQCSSGKQNQEQ